MSLLNKELLNRIIIGVLYLSLFLFASKCESLLFLILFLSCLLITSLLEFYNITKKKHFPLLETLAEEIFLKLFREIKIKKIKLSIEKLDIIKNTSSVGIEIEKSKSNEYSKR